MQNYNTHAQESAAGQLDLFRGEVMSKEDILNDVNNLFNNGTEQETADTRAEGVEEDGAVNNGGEGSNAAAQVNNQKQNGGIFEYFKGTLKELIRLGESATNELIKMVVVPNVSKRLKDDLAEKGVELKGDYRHTIDTFAVKHTLNEHADEAEVLRGQVPITPEDIELASDVIENYDEDGITIEENKRGLTNIIYKKTYPDGRVVYVEEVRGAKKGELAFVSMRKYKNKNSRLPNEAEEASTLGSSTVSERKDSNIIANNQAQVDETDIFSQNKAETESADGNSSPVSTAIAAAEAETDTNPSEAQKEAGNYKKGHVKVDGYDITIENPKGSVRSGKDADGKEWSVTMNNTYGYIRGTEGVDGDHIDVFLSDNPEQGNVYVVDQVDADGNFDEHKVMYGFGSADEARDNYLANYSEGWKMGTITEVSKEEFKKWIESSHRKTKPFSEYKSVKKEGAQGEAQKEPTPQEARDWLNAKYDGQSKPTDGTHAIGWISNLSDEDALVMYRAETLGSDPTKFEDDAFEVFQYFDDLSEGVTPSESAIPILEKYGKKFEDMDDTAYRKGESLKDYMQRNGDYIGTKRDYMVAKYGAEKVDSAVELFAEYNYGKAADIAQKLYDLGIKDKEEAMAIYDLAFDKKYVHTPNTLPFIDAFFDLAHSKNKKQQPSTATEEKETNVDKAIRIMKEIDDLSSELDELYTTGPEAEADRVSAEHMAKYGELEALEKSMTDEEKKALDKRLRDEVDDLDGEWAEWLEAGMKEEPVESTHSLNNAEAEKNQEPEKPQKTSQRKPRKTKPSTTTAGDEKINDVGEKIGGARKDATLNYAKKIDLEATVPSKIFPKPNFASMEKAGVPHETLVKLKAYYTAFSIINKNKRKRNENQRILSARFYASVARDMLLRDVDVFNESADGIVLTDYGKQHLELLVSCVEALDKKGVPGFFDLDISDVDITIGEFKENENGAYQTKDGKRWVGTYSYGRTNNMAAVRYKLFALDDIEGLAEEYCKQVEEAHSKNVQNDIKMHVYRMSSGKCYISAKVKGIADEIKLKDDFSSSKEAFDYIRENGDALRTEARAKADEMKQSKKNGGGTRKPTNDDIERMLRNIVQGTRIGKDYRNGKDVSAEDFMKEFGFRGVEFGNWATQKERQDHLNACYDALMDLADLIGISPKAISLGGKLAMAFGSRGHSSALAHYEPAKHVINLTKEHGAGCVAHEWFHAIDNYFGGGVFGLRMKSAVEGNSRDNLRSEMQKIFAEIGRALNGSDMKVRSKKLGNGDYWASTLEMAARAFESYVNERLMARGQMNQYLSAHVPGEAVQYEELAKNDPYPTAEESKKFGEIFDRLFDTVQEEVGDDGNVNLFQIADVEPGTENVTEAQQLATEAIITALGENAGLDVVMETREEGQRVAAEQNADTGMMALSNNEQEFDSMKKMAHDENGHVLPGLAEKTVTVVSLSEHGFAGTLVEAIKKAKEWAKSNLAGKEYDFPEGGKYVISNKAIGKYLSSSAFTKSDNSNVHLAALRMLPEIIGNSMDAEIHEDYKKGEDGKRNVNNGVENENKLVHRLYGAVTLGDKTYRVKTTMYEYRTGEPQNNTPHSYEITEIELLDSPVLPAEAVKNTIGISNNSISGANLLKNVEKSYDNGVKILENQQNTAEFMQVWHGSAAVFDHFDGAFMGSGEGSQVYGDGHYVTGVESTGRMYATIATENRQRSNTPIVRWKGQQVDFSSVNPLRLAHDVADSSRTIKEARDRAERYADMAEEDDMKTNWKLALDILKQSTKADFKPVPVNGNRQLYEVEIPDDNGSNYIGWNDAVSVSDQDKIEELLFTEVVNDNESDYTEKDRKQFHDDMGFGNKNLSVGDLYDTMTFAIGSKKNASALLRKAGIVGIKVPTGNRRGGDGRGTNYVIFDDNDLKITDRVQFMQRPEGTVYGWSEGNRIHLTPEGINPNTPIHEYTHLWARAVMQKNPKLWNRIKELLQGTPIWEEVVNDPAYQGLTSDDAIASEALSRLSGRKNAGKMEKMAQDLLNEAKGNGVFAEANAHTLILKMKQALKDFWKWVGTNLFDMTDVKNIDEVTDRVLYDLLNKTDLALSENGDVATEFQVVTDKATIEKLEASPKMTGYRNVVLRPDGTFGSPMASGLQSKGKAQAKTSGFEKNKWEQAEEHPDLADENGKVNLVKPDGKRVDKVDYNPYIHNRPNKVNKQFKQAWERPDLVYIKTEIPMVDLESGYHAEKAAKSVGVHNWPTPSSSQKLILSRYDKPVEIVPWEEVADDWEKEFKKSGVNFDIVPPALLPILAKRGVEILPPHKGMGEACEKAYADFLANSNGDLRFSERTEFDDGEVIDIVGNRGSQDFSLADSTMPSYSSKEELLHAFQEKHPAYAAVLTADGNGIEVTAWKSVLDNNIRKPRRRNGEPTKAEKQRAAYVERNTQIAIDMVNEKAQKLGLNVEVITDTESLPKNMADKKGWYNKATGKITIVLPNHSNGQDVMRTLMHEGVAHHGLRQMFGEDFNTFLNNVYANADIEVRRRIAELAARKGWDFHTATEEYLAALAEDIDFERKVDQTWWQKVKFFFIDMLRKAGIVLDDKLTDNDLRYIVWKSYERMAYAGDYGAIRDARTVMMDQQLGTGNFGTRAVADGSQVADGSELLYRDGEDETEDSAPLSMNESMIQGLITLAEKNKENAAYKTYVVKAIGGELAKLRKAMSAQKEYDRSTVEQLTGLARLLIKNGMFGNISEQEIMKLLTTIKNATGRNDITKYAQQIYDLMIKNQLEQARNMLDQVTRIKDSKVNAQGVEVQGQLDVRGQNLIKAFRKAMSLDEANISELLQNASDRMDSPDKAVADEAATEFAALTLAMQYVHDIKDSVADERVAKEELAQARKDHAAKTDGLSAKAFKEYVQEAEDAIRQKQLERIEAFHNLAARLAGAMQGSIESAKKFRERELERVKNIHHFANSDMQGRPANAHRVDNWKQKLANKQLLRILFNPLGTFDQMLRMIGNKSVNGEGYLYNHFMRGWLDATQKEFDNFHAACKVLDDKASEVFGKKMRWSDLYAEERKMPKAEITFVDVDGSERTVELNQGNLLYIYMANKMADGRMKLRAMGIMEDDIENIKQVLDPRFIKLADWLQEEFLVNKRNDYNAVHERMFGAPMAAIENYFPLRILGDARVQQVDVADDKIENELPSILTGSIIKRKTNKNPLDVMNTDAFSVVVEHLQQMEKWAAFAEWRRDLNTLLSYKRFRNQLKNMSSVYGAGNTLWRNFMIAGSIAAGTHRPKVDYDGVDTAMVNLAKGVTTAKIAFRVFTAIKQLLSAPAFMAESSLLNLGKSIATPWKAWNWAMEELPTFKKRWQSKQAGDTRLMKTDVDLSFWKNRLVDTLSRWGMSPNAFVDAMTVAIGGRAIYETKRARYIEDGYSEAEADKKAKQDAAVLVNQTQQSSETAFVSKMQLDRTVAAVSLSVFRNSSMSYQRQLVDAIRGLKRMVTPGYKDESIDFMAKQMIRDGLDEDAAKRAATRAYNREWVRNLSRTALFGFGMQMAWNLGAYLPYLIFGDDDDEKKEMLEDAAMHGLFGSIEGLSGGNMISELGNMKVKGESFRNYDMYLLPLMSDIKNIYTKFESDEIAAVNDMVNLLIQSGFGVNPQTITDAVVAITDACNGDVETGREATILFLRLAQAPQSQIDKLYLDEIGMRGDEASKLSVQQLAERYADYKKKRGATLMQWAYSDEQEKAVEDKYIKKFEKQAKERLMQTTVDAKLDDSFEAYEENYKDVKKRLEAVNKLKDEDFTEFYTRMGELASTPEFKKYNTFKGYKTVIDNLMKSAVNAKNADDREGYLRMIDERKRQLVERLDSIK
ncbi:MAG: LPD5 domain-containing protein [Prevotella sp.]|nr:LPD5 domain-containing protein [Prevotella sp.]